MSHNNWEEAEKNRSTWRRDVWQGILKAPDKIRLRQTATKRICRKATRCIHLSPVNQLCLHQLQQRLPLPHWTGQSHKTLQHKALSFLQGASALSIGVALCQPTNHNTDDQGRTRLLFGKTLLKTCNYFKLL